MSSLVSIYHIHVCLLLWIEYTVQIFINLSDPLQLSSLRTWSSLQQTQTRGEMETSAPGCREVSARSQAARCHLTTLQRLKNSVCLMNHFYEESFHKVFSFRSQNIPGNYFNGPLSMETGIYAIFILQNTSINPRLWLF